LKRLGVLTRGEVDELNQGVRELADQVRELMARQGGRPAARGTTKKRKAKKRASRASRAPRA